MCTKGREADSVLFIRTVRLLLELSRQIKLSTVMQPPTTPPKTHTPPHHLRNNQSVNFKQSANKCCRTSTETSRLKTLPKNNLCPTHTLKKKMEAKPGLFNVDTDMSRRRLFTMSRLSGRKLSLVYSRSIPI